VHTHLHTGTHTHRRTRVDGTSTAMCVISAFGLHKAKIIQKNKTIHKTATVSWKI